MPEPAAFDPDRAGMASHGRDEVGPLVLSAWDALLELAADIDLAGPSRLPGWRAHDVLVHLGAWPEHDALSEVVQSAVTGLQRTDIDTDATNARLVEAHRHEPGDVVLDALRLARTRVEDYLDSSDPALDLAPASSSVGTLPVLSVILGGTFELAVHALDLRRAGAAEPSEQLLLTGLAALADVTGALAAQLGVTSRTALHTPGGGWAFDVGAGGWTVERLGRGQPSGAAVEAPAATLLDLAAGRINPVAAISRGHLRVHDLRGLLRLAPIVESAPNLPGGPVLRISARSLGGLAHLPGLGRSWGLGRRRSPWA